MASNNPAEISVRAGHEPDTSDTFSASSDTPAPVRSAKALASALGIARSTLYEWFKLPGHPEPAADGTQDLGAWRAFAREIGSETEAGQTDDKDELQKEDLRLKNEQRRKKIEREDGLWTRNDQIDAELAPLVQEAKALLRSKFENELPALYSSDPAVQSRARELNKAAIDEVCDRLSDPLPCQGGAQEE